MLKKRFRLRSSKDFQKIYKSGKKYRGKYGMLVAMKADSKRFSSTPQFGYVVSKKMGNAVQRNKLTRQLKDLTIRELVQKEENFNGYVFSYIAYEVAESFDLLKDDVQNLFNDFLADER